MNLSKYLESMKNLPDRFSNLAFWRGVRKLKDEMVKTFEYVGEWGTSVETDITDIKDNITTLDNTDKSLDARIDVLENASGGMLVYKTASASFSLTTEKLGSNLDIRDPSKTPPDFLIPYPKVIYARFYTTLSNVEKDALIVNALMNGSVAISTGMEYSNTVQFTDEPLYAVKISATSYKLYTAWMPFSVKTETGFSATSPNLTVNYTYAVVK